MKLNEIDVLGYFRANKFSHLHVSQYSKNNLDKSLSNNEINNAGLTFDSDCTNWADYLMSEIL